jgi:hypothetical protein
MQIREIPAGGVLTAAGGLRYDLSMMSSTGHDRSAAADSRYWYGFSFFPGRAGGHRF